MGIMFVATEVEDWQSFNSVAIVNHTSTALFNPANSRAATAMPQNTEFGYSVSSFPFSSNEFWVSFSGHFAGQPNFTPHKFLALLGGGSRRIALGQSAANTALMRAYKWNGSSWDTIGTGPMASFTATRAKYDMYIKLGNPGIFRLYKDSAAIIAETPDFSFGGLSNLTSLEMYNAVSAGGGIYSAYSEVLVATWNTIGSKVVTRVPDANGTHTAWTGAGFSAIDEIVPGIDYMTSNLTDEKASYLLTDFPALAAGETLAGVLITSLANRDGGGPQNMNNFVRIGATDYHQADQSLGVPFTSRVNILETSPATTNPWTVTELNAAEFGFRSRA